MKILSVNSFHTQNRKQDVNFEAAKFDSQTTIELVQLHIAITGLGKFLRDNMIKVPKKADSCYIVVSEFEKIKTGEANSEDLIKHAIRITGEMVRKMAIPSQDALVERIRAEEALSIARKSFDEAKKSCRRAIFSNLDQESSKQNLLKAEEIFNNAQNTLKAAEIKFDQEEKAFKKALQRLIAQTDYETLPQVS